MKTRSILALAMLTVIATSPDHAAAKSLRFMAALSGATAHTNTGSKATGKAQINIDLKRKLVTVEIDVSGITRDGLWDKLVAAPIGPIHFHQYGSHDHSGEDVKLVLPVPYGANYTATTTGFHVSMRNYSFAAGAKLVGCRI
jgi:hypothetical protein